MQRLAWSLAVVLVAGAGGCKPGTTEPAQGSKPGAPAAVATKAPRHPCDLLADAAVVGAVSGAQPGQRDLADEAYGIATCRWTAGDGAVVLQAFDAGPGALPPELRSAALEIVDVRRPDAAALVRMERLAGIADTAGAYVERADAKRGITRSNAVLMVQRGGRLAVLRIPQIADGDRDQSLETLKTLGTEIAKGL